MSTALRVVTLAPFLTELVYAAGAGDKLVAVSAYSDFPAAAKKMPMVADAFAVNFETLLSLKPTLILAWKTGNREADLNRLRQLGLPLFVAEASGADDVPRLLRLFGKLANTAPIAEIEAMRFESALADLSRLYSNQRLIRTFVEIGQQPLMTISARHSISHVLKICGGENVFSSAIPLTPIVDGEALLRANPEVVLIAQAGIGEAAKKIPNPERYQRWPIAAQISGSYFAIDADYLLRPTSRLLNGAKAVCEALDQVRRATVAVNRSAIIQP